MYSWSISWSVCLFCTVSGSLTNEVSNSTRFGHYGFLSYFGGTPAEIVDQVDEMFAAGVRDVQFYDWFDNYAGQYQHFIRRDTRGKDPNPEWWRQEKWTEPWDSHLTVRKSTLTAAIARVRERGGRSWAYVQAVASEYWDLAGAPDNNVSCGKPVTSVLHNASFTNLSTLRVCKLRNKTSWVFHEGPSRIFPTYFMSYDLGTFQAHAWIPIIKELGFCGIHWDTLGVKAVDYVAESLGVQAFVRASKIFVSGAGLQQTLNQIDAHWWSRDLFSSRVLEFPYSEIWSPFHEALFWDRSVGLAGAVIANYPGTIRNGCCCIDPSDCRLCVDATSYKRCPGNITQDILLQIRWKKACTTGARYLIIGNGLRRLVTEYFVWTTLIDSNSLELIKTSRCNFVIQASPLIPEAYAS